MALILTVMPALELSTALQVALETLVVSFDRQPTFHTICVATRQLLIDFEYARCQKSFLDLIWVYFSAIFTADSLALMSTLHNLFTLLVTL